MSETARSNAPLSPPLDFLHECFLYDPIEGTLTWRNRPRDHFANDRAHKRWNTCFAEKPALSTLNAQGYLIGVVKAKDRIWSLKHHRVAYALMTGLFPDTIDHIDGNKNNNRFCNIRAASLTENLWNRGVRRQKSSGLPKWVRKSRRRYDASVRVNGRQFYIGHFETPEAAHSAALRFAKEKHGVFVRPS